MKKLDKTLQILDSKLERKKKQRESFFITRLSKVSFEAFLEEIFAFLC